MLTARIADRARYHGHMLARRRARRRDVRHIRRSMTADAELFREPRPLPDGYGRGLSERAVEFGWAMSQGIRGRVLDAGSTFNHPHTLGALLPRIDSLNIFTLVPEETNFPERGVIYDYGDLRSMPYADGTFDWVMSLSVVEHIGMDNTNYGAGDDRDGHPNAAVAAAIAEMLRVLRPGGQLLLTVPYGKRHDHGWFRVFDADDIAAMLSAIGDASSSVTTYAVDESGWQLSSLHAAAQSEYGAWQATAVACIRATARG